MAAENMAGFPAVGSFSQRDGYVPRSLKLLMLLKALTSKMFF